MANTGNPNSDATSSAAEHSTRHSTSDTNNPASSPQSRRGSSRSVSHPWKQVVRGELEPVLATADGTPSSSSSSPVVDQQVVDSSSTSVAAAGDEGTENENGLVRGNAGKKPVWNKLSNGAAEVEPVMGASSWPALSESARVSTKSSSSDSLKGLSDGPSSIPFSQGTGTASLSSQKQHSSIANSNSAPSHPVPTRQRSMKRNGGNTSSNGGMAQGPGGELPLNNPSPGDHGQRSLQSRSSNDHPQQPRNSFRNRNGGPHSRDGSHHHNYGNHDWTPHRSFTNREAHMQPQRGTPRFMRPPPPPPLPTTTPYLAPPPLRPFPPMGFPELTPIYYVGPSDSLRAVPFIAPMPPVFYSAPDLQLHSKIVNQIDYYFSNENLIKDTFLRQNMDEQGWVPIKLIAGFKKVSLLTDNIPFILESLKSSTVVEVQGDKVRKLNEWMRWIMPTDIQFPNVPSPRLPGNSSPDKLVANVQSTTIEEGTRNQNNSSQVDLDTKRVGETLQGGMDHPSMRRNSSK